MKTTSGENLRAELARRAGSDALLARLLTAAGASWSELYWALLRAGFADDALIARVKEAARLEAHV